MQVRPSVASGDRVRRRGRGSSGLRPSRRASRPGRRRRSGSSGKTPATWPGVASRRLGPSLGLLDVLHQASRGNAVEPGTLSASATATNVTDPYPSRGSGAELLDVRVEFAGQHRDPRRRQPGGPQRRDRPFHPLFQTTSTQQVASVEIGARSVRRGLASLKLWEWLPSRFGLTTYIAAARIRLPVPVAVCAGRPDPESPPVLGAADRGHVGGDQSFVKSVVRCLEGSPDDRRYFPQRHAHGGRTAVCWTPLEPNF